MNHQEFSQRIAQLNVIGIALSAERDQSRLMELILDGAQQLTRADGGTLYLIEGQHLHFKIIHNRSLGYSFNSDQTNTDLNTFPAIPLYNKDGSPRLQTVAARSVLTGATINIPDIHKTKDFDFSGTLAYDQRTGYHSHAFLSVPLRNHERDIIGVLQLINPMADDDTVTAFFDEDIQLVESLASQAAVAITNQTLTHELRILLERFIEVIADAIDEKSPYTGGHCRRVPEIAMLLANAVNNHNNGPLAKCKFSDKELYELKIAALMHDCGKIITPVHVVDKATKLETIFDRIKLIEARYEILKRDVEIAHLKASLTSKEQSPHSSMPPPALGEQFTQLEEELDFLRTINFGGEFLDDDKKDYVRTLAQMRTFTLGNTTQPLLDEDEVHNLTIAKGTLNEDERKIINQHISSTQRMLSSLPFPKHLQQVPEIAGNHHERMDGHGYPNGLNGKQMSLRARVLAISDIFEALTAADRPYKKAMPVSVALRIMKDMAAEGHIDPDLYDVFIQNKTYYTYGQSFLRPEQNDLDTPPT